MADVTFTVKNDLVDRILDGFKGNFPIPTDPVGAPLYTDIQWFKRCVIDHVRYVVLRYEKDVAIRAVHTSNPLDNDAVE